MIATSPAAPKSRTGRYTCPSCWRSDRESVDEYAALNAASYLPVIACTECAAKLRRAGAILDYVGPAGR